MKFKMIKPFLLFIFLLCGQQSFSQLNFEYTKAKGDSCHILDNLHFKHGVDTVKLKATFYSVGLTPDRDVLYKLQRKKILKSKDFSYAIEFKPEGCTMSYIITSHDKGKDAQSLFNLHTPTPIWLRLIVYNQFIGSVFIGKPFFVVDKVSFSPF